MNCQNCHCMLSDPALCPNALPGSGSVSLSAMRAADLYALRETVKKGTRRRKEIEEEIERRERRANRAVLKGVAGC